MWRKLTRLLIRLYVVIWQVLRVCGGLMLFSCAAAVGGACHYSLVRTQVYQFPAPVIGHNVSSRVEVLPGSWFEAG